MVVCDRCQRGGIGIRKVTVTVQREALPSEPAQEPTKLSVEVCQGCEDAIVSGFREAYGKPA